jgi:hypothetical protein
MESNEQKELPKSSLKIIIQREVPDLTEKWCQLDKPESGDEYPNMLHLSITDMLRELEVNPELSQLELHFVPELEKIMKWEYNFPARYIVK